MISDIHDIVVQNMYATFPGSRNTVNNMSTIQCMKNGADGEADGPDIVMVRGWLGLGLQLGIRS